jgi:hypothetical protein
VDILSSYVINRELEAFSKIEVIEADAQQAPLNILAHKGF